ncbi:MAG: hypothetical protein JRG79_04920 [Deltaproteobacteria bacterium]|nr:hypothetical protein [Deltaproteobacteria bacterium]
MPDEDIGSNGLGAETGGFLLLNKQERAILKEILSRSLTSPEGVQYIRNTFGEEYVQLGLEFLNRLGGSFRRWNQPEVYPPQEG